MVKVRKSIIKAGPKPLINVQQRKQEITRYVPALINAEYQFLPVKAGLLLAEYEAITGLVNMYFCNRSIITTTNPAKRVLFRT